MLTKAQRGVQLSIRSDSIAGKAFELFYFDTGTALKYTYPFS
jgi:hypothetical protein